MTQGSGPSAPLGVSNPSGEGDVVHLDVGVRSFVRGEGRVEGELARLGERTGPEVVEVGGLVALGEIVAQLLKRQVEQRH
jgi:hypothetical protein